MSEDTNKANVLQKLQQKAGEMSEYFKDNKQEIMSVLPGYFASRLKSKLKDIEQIDDSEIENIEQAVKEEYGSWDNFVKSEVSNIKVNDLFQYIADRVGSM